MMRFSHYPDGTCPIYILPTWEEIAELAADRPDTLRICVDAENSIWGPPLAAASGYGNTHQTIVQMVHKLGDKRWNPTALILHRENSLEWLLNPDGAFGRSDRLSLKDPLVKQHLTMTTFQFLQDFTKLWQEY